MKFKVSFEFDTVNELSIIDAISAFLDYLSIDQAHNIIIKSLEKPILSEEALITIDVFK